MRKVYADHASTSFPKALGVTDAMKAFLDVSPYNVNRGGYGEAYGVAMEIIETRELVADLFHLKSPKQVVFTSGITAALNMLLGGFFKKGDHVITTAMEHNAVMRPLFALSQKGVTYSVIPCNNEGFFKADALLPLIRPNTRAVVMTHGSNVCGSLLPLNEVAALCKSRGLKLIVDAAQTAGVIDINANAIDALAFAGHKSLLGPQGIGGFVIDPGFAKEVEPLLTGGTGSQSHALSQPDFLPDKFEPGTMNLPGIIGLKKALEYIKHTGTFTLYQKEMAITQAFMEKVQGLHGVALIGPKTIKNRLGVVSLAFLNLDNGAVAAALDQNYGIMTRSGLHCAPGAHQALGTFPKGTVRFSFGYQNTLDEVDYIISSLQQLLKEGTAYGF